MDKLLAQQEQGVIDSQGKALAMVLLRWPLLWV